MCTNPVAQYFLIVLGSCGALIFFFSFFTFSFMSFQMYWSRCSCLPVVLVYSCIGFVTTLCVYCKPSKMVMLCCWYIVTHFNTKTTRTTSLKCLLGRLQKDTLKEKSYRNQGSFRSGVSPGTFVSWPFSLCGFKVISVAPSHSSHMDIKHRFELHV